MDHGQARQNRRRDVAVDENWTDVSSWYWSAMLGRSCGPWWVVTIAE
ncbi:MAG: hypothetical protein L0220_30200 [Acidobacteria bacterium]|nr:hypothetical protein [Acidobacteriota bacterium]